MTERIDRFLAEIQPATPCLVVDLEVVKQRYLELKELLPLARIFYAVKANPAPEVLRLLVGLGASFDAASRGEIELCLEAGAPPERISFGNTIKKERDIAWAMRRACAYSPSTATPSWTSWRDRRPARRCSAGCSPNAPAPSGLCRASSAARRTWRLR